MAHSEDSDEIIGELQFCYLTGMILGNLACLEQWAHIVKVVFKAYRLALDDPEFFVKFIDAIHAQFVYDEEGIEGSIMDQDPTLSDDLRMILTIFKSRLNELLLAKGAELTPAQTRVGQAFESLESFLWKWDWDLRGNYVRSGKACFTLFPSFHHCVSRLLLLTSTCTHADFLLSDHTRRRRNHRRLPDRTRSRRRKR